MDRRKCGVSFLTSRDIPFDKVVKMDVDRFATYELDELFDEQDHIIMNQTMEEEGHLLNVVAVTQEVMTELDKIRIKEFVQDVAKYDEVYGLTKKVVSSLFSLVKMIATKKAAYYACMEY